MINLVSEKDIFTEILKKKVTFHVLKKLLDDKFHPMKSRNMKSWETGIRFSESTG